MCGIFGWCQHDAHVEPETVRQATSALRHRGPDDEGYLFLNTGDGRVLSAAGTETDRRLPLPSLMEARGQAFDLALGFRRLSILDLSEAGHQPMRSHDGRYWIVFNGEIYNYRELQEELGRTGYTFRTGTDTEVLLAAHHAWGLKALPRLVGMFAFAIVDTKERKLVLARDAFGIKPLYYLATAQRFAFASEIKPLLGLPGVRTRADAEEVCRYLHSGVTDSGAGTLFEGIRQLLPAHVMVVDLRDPREITSSRWWTLPLDATGDLSFDRAAERVRELFLESVRLHLRSDVPVGSALSGGVDSSSIVLAMRNLQGPDLTLRTFSYVAADKAVSEESWMDLVNRAAGSRACKIQPMAEDLARDLDELIRIQEQPFGSTSIYAQHRVFRAAAEAGIKVMQDGQGADELLAGYPRFYFFQLRSLVNQRRWQDACTFVRKVRATPELRRALQPWRHGPGLLCPQPLRSAWQRARTGRFPPWMKADWFLERGVQPAPGPFIEGPHALRSALRDALTSTSLPMLLRYEDRNSMAHSIEARVPFLTTALAEFLFALPEDYILDLNGTSKAVFRRAMRAMVPDAVLDRRDKIGFVTSEKQWMTALRGWVETTLSRTMLERVPALDHRAVRREVPRYIERSGPWDFRLWRWLNLVRWSEQFDVLWT